jgi:hypothetical protein
MKRFFKRVLIAVGLLFGILVAVRVGWWVVDPESLAAWDAKVKARGDARAEARRAQQERKPREEKQESAAVVDAADMVDRKPRRAERVREGGVESTSRSMSFPACLELIRATATDLAVAPINLVETDILRMVRFNTTDGSVLVSCSALDEKVVLTRSPYQG